MRSKCHTCVHCCLVLCLSVALRLSIKNAALHCILSVALFPLAFSALLHPDLQCKHSVALVAKVGPLAMVSSLPDRVLNSSAVFYCVVSRGFSFWFVWDCVPPPFIYLGSHLSSFYLPVVFSFLYFNDFCHYYYCCYYFTLVYNLIGFH